MKYGYRAVLICLFLGVSTMVSASNFIPANNPNIQYYGRWDTTDPLHVRHSWPGVYIVVEFTGTKIGVRIADNTSYYNVEIDGKLYPIFHGDVATEKDYILVEGLKDTTHSLRFSKRNFSFSQIAVFAGFILDDNAQLLPPPPRPERKMEFIGDSFTASEGNEAKELEMKWEDKFPVTNMDLGFAAVTAKHFGAEYHTVCRSGAGMVCDWQSDTSLTVPMLFDRTLMEANEPKWDFISWVPDVVVICLGLNDHSGLKGKDGEVPDEKSLVFRNGYHKFIKAIYRAYRTAKIVAVAAHTEWIQENVKQVVDEENAAGNKNIYFAKFGFYDNGYVANGHPSVETHKKIAEEIIKVIEAENLFSQNLIK
jgi:lysophospholipase L1-like esterase